MATPPTASKMPPGCGCKGIRSCLLCEPLKESSGGQLSSAEQRKATFVYCPTSGLAVGEDSSDFSGWAFPFSGVVLINDFVNEDEERVMTSMMDLDTWKVSQSGRRKQDYGPNVNFKKQKLKVGHFSGLPTFSKDIVRRMEAHSVLQGFQPVEQCNLDYDPQRGSSIDPHFDDWWLWGERLVTLNLLSETVLTMSCDSADKLVLFRAPSKAETTNHTSINGTSHKKPNMVHREACSTTVPASIQNNGQDPLTRCVPFSEVQVSICLPHRSLVILSGDARRKWKHAIYRKHIEHRRICCTFRELSAEFSAGGKEEELGKKLLDIALSFKGRPT